MASTFSPTLRIELIGNGDQSGTWGQTTNRNLGTLLEQAITGVVTITMTDANYTLSNFNGISDEARNQVIVATGTNNAQRDIIAPLVEKLYVVKNSTVGGFAIRIRGSSGASVTISNGATVWVYCDGTDFYPINTESAGNFEVNGDLSVTGATTLSSTLGVTGATTLSSTLGVTGATTLSSNLAFTGTGNRITGDFSNATKENRVWIQTSTTNNGTGVYIVPNGTATDAGSTVFNANNLTNAGYFNFSINNTAASIDSGRFGSGTFLPMTFITNGSERMRLSTSGYLSVGSTASEGLITSDGGPTVGGTVLAVKGGNSVSQCAQIGFYNTFAGTPNPNKFIRVNNQGDFEIINSDYSVGIFQLTNGGAAYNTTGTWGTISDARVKENVETARDYLSDLCRLRVVKYSLKSEESQVPTKLGFVAQEVEQVFPNMVEESLDTFGDLGNIKQIKLSVLTPMLVKAIQEQQTIINDLKARIETLEAK